MTELTDWLSAQLDADEAAARAATPGPWRDVPMGSEGSDVQAGGNTITTARRPARCREFADATHIARHDPARVLVEVEANRAIVEWVQLDLGEGHSNHILRLLASVFADRPGFDETWRP